MSVQFGASRGIVAPQGDMEQQMRDTLGLPRRTNTGKVHFSQNNSITAPPGQEQDGRIPGRTLSDLLGLPDIQVPKSRVDFTA
jgi:hypothetical protein